MWRIFQTGFLHFRALHLSEESLKMLRANRALAMCLSLHEAHPLLLMVRAAKGDRQAALDLIKVDKLFLHDRCTENLIKKAGLQNDRAFMRQLARAQVFVPKLSTREIQRLYFYQLFLMEQGGYSCQLNMNCGGSLILVDGNTVPSPLSKEIFSAAGRPSSGCSMMSLRRLKGAEP